MLIDMVQIFSVVLPILLMRFILNLVVNGTTSSSWMIDIVQANTVHYGRFNSSSCVQVTDVLDYSNIQYHSRA
jgi:hypothetical protein